VLSRGRVLGYGWDNIYKITFYIGYIGLITLDLDLM